MKKLFKSTTSFQHTVTTLSFHNHISTYTTTSVQHLKSLLPPKIIFFLLLHIKFYEKQVSLIHKLQPLSYQFTSNITPRLSLFAFQLTPGMYNATALLTHSWYTYKNVTPALNIDAQIYAPTASCLISKEICVWWTRFYRPIRDGSSFRILPEVIDRRRGTKGSRPLGTRLDGFWVLKVAQQSWLLLYAFFPPLFFRFSCLIFFSFWTSSRLHFGGKSF